MRWAGNVARTEATRNAYILVGKHKGKRLLARLGLDGRMILK